MSSESFVEVVDSRLDLNRYVRLVGDPGAGAIATFTGVTRDNFEGKTVLSLSYEAYGPMAEKEMQVIPGRGLLSRALSFLGIRFSALCMWRLHCRELFTLSVLRGWRTRIPLSMNV